MPAITIRVFEGELTWGQTAEMVDDVTEAVVPFVGEGVRSNVCLLVEKLSRRRSHRLATQANQSEDSCNEPLA
jgi:phenylpyruvate tautomerase PptA (4-oxalocrotonate tautomerase family)